jgi:hypothetical protein
MMWKIPQQYLMKSLEVDELKVQIEQMGEPWCYESGAQAEGGECPVHRGDACLRTPEGLIQMIHQYQQLCEYMGLQLIDVHDIPAPYDPDFGDDRVCKCGHPYYRHFDTYEDMRPVGCKYCYDPACLEFQDSGEPDPGPPESL